MLKALYSILLHTPTYVYAIFGYLIYVGIKASKDRTISLYRAILLPLAFFYIAINTLMHSFEHKISVYLIWFFFLLIGIGFGWLQVYRQKIKIDKIKKLLFLPGTWSTLIIVLVIFAAKYYFGFKFHQDPQIFQNFGFQYAALFIYGSTAGLFIGRFLNYFYRFHHHMHHDLTK